MEMHAAIISRLGFSYENGFDVTGRLSIADRFPKSKSRCGIYLLGFPNDIYYIGQAIDAVRRFAQHRKNYSDIVSYWFQAVDKSQLDYLERTLIQQAEEQGLLLSNRTFVSNVIGETDLDLIMSEPEQKEWLWKDCEQSTAHNELYAAIAEKFKIKYRQKFDKLSQTSIYPRIKKILQIYATCCLPKAATTQLSFWSLSCLPSTNGNERYFCLNVNGMEVFVMGQHKNASEPFSFLVASRSILNEDNIQAIRLQYTSLKVYYDNYQAAGPDQVTLDFGKLDDLENCLTYNSLVRQAIKHLNLRLMRKGGTIYSPYHCFDLANAILT